MYISIVALLFATFIAVGILGGIGLVVTSKLKMPIKIILIILAIFIAYFGHLGIYMML